MNTIIVRYRWLNKFHYLENIQHHWSNKLLYLVILINEYCYLDEQCS